MKKIMFLIALVAIGGAILAQNTQKKNAIVDTLVLTKDKISDFVSSSGKNELSAGGIESAKKDLEFDLSVKVMMDLNNKVLRGPEDTARLESILSSRSNMDFARKNLQTLDGINLVENQRNRMRAGLFLINALELKTNSEREYLKSTVQKLIFDDSMEKITDRDLRRSVLADRIELFVALKHTDPQFAKTLEQQITSPLHKQMVQFAVNFYDLKNKEN